MDPTVTLRRDLPLKDRVRRIRNIDDPERTDRCAVVILDQESLTVLIENEHLVNDVVTFTGRRIDNAQLYGLIGICQVDDMNASAARSAAEVSAIANAYRLEELLLISPVIPRCTHPCIP